MIELNQIINADAIAGLETLPDESINCVITSPPYWGLRDYEVEGQLGLEKTPEEYVLKMVETFRECWRVLKKDGTLWLNLGDSYANSGKGAASYPENAKLYKQGTNKGMLGTKAVNLKMPVGYKPKDLIGIPWMVAFALRTDGWYLRQDIIWHKPNPMPESVTDRCTKSHEYIFLLSKSVKYYFTPIMEIATGYDGRKDILMNGFYPTDVKAQSIASKGHERWNKKIHKSAYTPGQQPHSKALKRMNGESDPEYPTRNKRSVWTVATQPFKEAHFAMFPENLITDCILAGCPEGGIVLDPFMGSGTIALVALKHDRNFIGIELNSAYVKIAEKRIEYQLNQGKLF